MSNKPSPLQSSDTPSFRLENAREKMPPDQFMLQQYYDHLYHLRMIVWLQLPANIIDEAGQVVATERREAMAAELTETLNAIEAGHLTFSVLLSNQSDLDSLDKFAVAYESIVASSHGTPKVH